MAIIRICKREGCGIEFKKQGRRVFCCEECYQKDHQDKANIRKRVQLRMIVCAICHKEFMQTHPNQRYDRAKCRKASIRQSQQFTYLKTVKEKRLTREQEQPTEKVLTFQEKVEQKRKRIEQRATKQQPKSAQ